jgi:hypothetical protein
MAKKVTCKPEIDVASSMNYKGPEISNYFRNLLQAHVPGSAIA